MRRKNSGKELEVNLNICIPFNSDVQFYMSTFGYIIRCTAWRWNCQVQVLLGTSNLSGFCPTEWDVPTVQSCAKPTCAHLAYCAVFTNNSFDNNSGIPLAFPTNNWNIFNSNVTSFRAPTSDLQGKWNASLAKAQRNPFVHCCWSFSTTSLTGDNYLYLFWVGCQYWHMRIVALKCFLGLFFFYREIKQKYLMFHRDSSCNLGDPTGSITRDTPFGTIKLGHWGEAL